MIIVTTSHLSLSLMRGQLLFLREAGFDVMVVASAGKFLERAGQEESVRTTGIPIAREIAPFRDLYALSRVFQAMRRYKPAMSNVGTPKAGLLAGIAALLARVPCRLYTLRGLRSETLMGPKRWAVWLTEMIACRSAHRVICVSESLRRKAIAQGIVNAQRAVVLASGSSNGVDAKRFAPTEDGLRRATDLRRKLGIPVNSPVVGFVGRLTRDKGVVELLDAYLRLRRELPNLRLLLVGAPEEGDRLPKHSLDAIANDPQIICPGFVDDAADYYHVMDVLALPTHREGFPNVVLEAHAAGKPVVGARATGVVDAVVDGVDGILVLVGDSAALAEALGRLLKNKALAADMGRAGRERVLREFRQERIWGEMLKEYAALLREKGLPLPDPSPSAAIAEPASDCEVAAS
jgi:glycosyltransferase involved in cell wall biosynthesis